jgi:hypothetical protein
VIRVSAGLTTISIGTAGNIDELSCLAKAGHPVIIARALSATRRENSELYWIIGLRG